MKQILSIILLASTLLQSQNYEWELANPIADRLKAVFFTDSLTGWTIGSQNFTGSIYKTTDGGYNWLLNYSIGGGNHITGRYINDVYFTSKDSGWVCGQDVSGKHGFMLQTVDGGNSWILHNDPDWGPLVEIDFINSKTGWILSRTSSDTVYTTDNTILYTTNAGHNWMAIQVPSPGKLNSIDFVDKNEGWVVGLSGTILHTKDGGQIWTQQNSPTSMPLRSLEFADSLHGWATTYSGTTELIRTSDGGRSWDIQGFTAGGVFSIFALNGDEVWSAGTGEIKHSSNGFNTWVDDRIQTVENIYDIFFINFFTGWAIGENGAILIASPPIPIDSIYIDTRPTNSEKLFTSFKLSDYHATARNWIDYDNDDDLDIFLTVSNDINPKNQLFKNIGRMTFQQVSENELIRSGTYAVGSCWGDYDNDDDLDLLLSATNGLVLYENLGSGVFEAHDFYPEILAGFYQGKASSWVDFNNDGLLDFFVANGSGSNLLYKQEKNGKFIQITEGGLVTDNEPSSGCAWGDFDNDGDQDLFIANERHPDGMGAKNSFYINNGNGTFSKNESNVFGDSPKSISCAWADYNNDGMLDIYITNDINQKNILYKNIGNGQFIKIDNLDVVNYIGDSYSVNWVDYDNDGWIDLFIGESRYSYLYKNNGHEDFDLVTDNGVPDAKIGQSWADYDKDGDVDILGSVDEVNGFSTNYIYKNNGNNNNWINIKCIGNISNKSAIGTRLTLSAVINGEAITQVREISGGGFGGQNDLNVHFGLGNSTLIDSLIIRWPSGIINKYFDITVNQFLIYDEKSTPPTILLPTKSDTTSPGEIYEFHPIITDDDQDSVVISLINAPAWLSVVDNSYLRGTPGSSNTGEFEIFIRADDLAGGIKDTSFTLLVLNNQPPIPVSDLRLSGEPGENNVFLKWTAPGGHWKEGQASSYDLRYSESPITESSFNSASVVPNLPVPNTFNNPDSMDVVGLSSSTKYYFALKSINSEGQTSSISNILPVITAGTTNIYPAEIITHGSSQAYIDSLYYYNESNQAQAIGTPPIIWSKVIGPEDFSINSDGRINWTPDSSEAAFGSLLIVIRAENTYGISDDSITAVFSNKNVTELVTSDTSDQFLDFSDVGVTMPGFDNQSDISGTVTVNEVDTIPEYPGTGSAFSFGNQYWVIDSSFPDGEFETTLVFHYDETKLDTLKEIELIAVHRKNPEDEWTAYPDQELDTLNNKITLYNVSDFSIFAPADDPSTTTSIFQKQNIINDFTLNQNYPNPFNPSTTIEFGIPLAGKVELNIYNILGQKVISLANNEFKGGKHKIKWNGYNSFGRKVSSGIYIMELVFGGNSIYKRMLLLK